MIHTDNHGVQTARNIGLDSAEGGYIALADSDDALDLDCYEILINAMEKTESDVSCCGFRNEYTTNMHIVDVHKDVPEPYVIDKRENCLLSVSNKEHCSAGFMWNKVFKKEVIREVRFRPEITICDDLFFTYESLNNAGRICITDLPMYHYRYLPASLSKQGSVQKFERCLAGLEQLNRWIEKNAPFCRKGVYVNYIFWNTKTCESMLKHVDKRIYEAVKGNIESYKEYVPYCSRRIQILANAIMQSWSKYAFFGWIFWCMKKFYILLKRLVG